ncbi:MAG: tetratricopeptide repeat protein [Desulfobacter sp.]|nr:MAG: tetratricopeptide repeat protein [Desulfobacter sp.]
MPHNEMPASGEWTEQRLGNAIQTLKEQQNDRELDLFLEARLADPDAFCLASRTRLWNELGLSKVRQDAPEQAALCFGNALALSPEYTAALYNLATLDMNRGVLGKALDRYEQILSSHPDHFDALLNAGLCHAWADDKAAALPLFLRAAGADPGNGQASFLAGETLLQAGRAKEALPYFESACRINQGHFESLTGLAIARLKSGEAETAAITCDQILMTFGAATLPLQVKADALIEMGRMEDAVGCHADICRLDLDIRDFVVTRIRELSRREPEKYKAYAALVKEKFPELESLLGAALEYAC